MKKTTLRITFTSIMIALSAVLSFVPIPGFPTLALDSLPGFFTALFVNPFLGGIVALFGHLATALVHGFPLGFPAHIIVAFSMLLSAYCLGKLFNKKHLWTLSIAIIVAIALNIYSSMPFLNLLLKIPYDYLLVLQIPLLIASLVNIVLAIVVYFFLKKVNYDFKI